MNTEQDAALQEIHFLAQKYNWPQLFMLADDIRSTRSTQRIVVAAPSDTSISPFRNWVEAVTRDGIVVSSTLEELPGNPARVITAEKPIAVFECGRLIEADAVAVVTRTFLSRPAGSYALVMTYAERIEIEEDLDLVERSIRRLLLSNSMTSWETQDLLELGVYLWTNSQPVEWLKPRLQRDQDALTAWLRTSIPIDSALMNALIHYRTLYALDMAEDQLNQQERTLTPQTSIDQSQRIYHVRQSIDELRLQLMRQIDRNVTSVERTLLTSLQALEADLLGSLRPFMVQHHEITFQGEDAFREAMTHYVAEGARSWQSRADHMLATSNSYMVTDTETLMQGIDWPLVNQLAVQQGRPVTYPDMLVNALTKETASAASGLKVRQEQMRSQMITSTPGGTYQPTMGEALLVGIGAGVTSSVALLLGIGPVGLAALGVAGIVGIEVLSRRRRSTQRANDQEENGRELIQHTIREARFRVQEQVQANRQSHRTALETELRTVMAMLDQALQECRSPLETDNPFPVERERLQEFRRKITANAS